MFPGHPIILLKSNLFEHKAKCRGGGRGNLSAPLQSFSSSSSSTSNGSRVHHNNEKPLLLERPPQKTLTLHALLRPYRSHASIYFSDGGRTQEIIACSILKAFVTGHHERRVKRLAGQDVIIAGHCPRCPAVILSPALSQSSGHFKGCKSLYLTLCLSFVINAHARFFRSRTSGRLRPVWIEYGVCGAKSARKAKIKE